MQLDLTSFFLELINFVVLVWILHRFLYKPVLAAIDRRRAAVEKSLAQAKTARDEAGTLKAQVEQRLASWQRERAEAQGKLAVERAAQRDRLGHHAPRAERKLGGLALRRGGCRAGRVLRADDAQPEPVGVDERHRRPVGSDRRTADVGDDRDHLLHGERLGQGSYDAISNSIASMFNFNAAPRLRRLYLNPKTGEPVPGR